MKKKEEKSAIEMIEESPGVKAIRALITRMTSLSSKIGYAARLFEDRTDSIMERAEEQYALLSSMRKHVEASNAALERTERAVRDHRNEMIAMHGKIHESSVIMQANADRVDELATVVGMLVEELRRERDQKKEG